MQLILCCTAALLGIALAEVRPVPLVPLALSAPGVGLIALRWRTSGAALIAVVLVLFGGWLALSTRRPPGGQGAPPKSTARMSADEARSILGVSANASPEEIKAAYTRLMRSVHPDKGGTSGLAAQLNAARDRLLKG